MSLFPSSGKSLPAPRPTPALIVAMLFAISMISYIERVNISAVGPSLKDELGLINEELGLLLSTFLLGYAICQFPAGALADRFGPRRVLAASLLCWGCLTVLTVGAARVALFSGFGVLGLFGVRFLLGVTVSPTYPAAARSIFCWVPGPRLALANALVISGLSVGTALTPLIVSYLVGYLGWQAAFCFTAVPSFVMAIVWYVISRDDGPELRPATKALIPSGDLPYGGAADRKPGSFREWSRFLWDKNLWFLTASYALQGYVSYIFVFWFFLYLVQERHFDIVKGSWVATTPWLLTLITMPLGATCSDWAVRRLGYPWGRRVVPMAAMAAAGVLLFFGARAENAYVAVGLFALCQGLVMAVEGVFWASMIEISRARAGSAGGILNMGGNLGGLPSPYITPLIAGAYGWVRALDVGAAIAVLAGLLWFWISPQAGEAEPLIVEYAADPPLAKKSEAITTDPLP